MGSFYQKQKKCELKIYRGIMCCDTEECWKIWREIDLSFQNLREEFDEFWSEYSKGSKIYTLLGSFWQKFITFDIKKYGGVIFHDT